MTVTVTPQETSSAAVEAVHATYRGEVAKLKMQLAIYRDTLLEHGIDPPDHEADDLLEIVKACNAVISTTSQFAVQLGTAKELLYGWPQA